MEKVKPKGKRGAKGKHAADDEFDTIGNVAEDIDMDIHDKAGEKRREEEAQEKKVRLDAEDKAFLDLFQ